MNLSRYIRHYMKNPLVLGTFLLTASGVLSRTHRLLLKKNFLYRMGGGEEIEIHFSLCPGP